MNAKRRAELSAADSPAWRRNAPLKSRWYDDQFGDERGNDVSAREFVENRVRALDERALHGVEEDVRSREVERFFDLFDQGSTREPQS